MAQFMNYNVNAPDFPKQPLFGFVHTNANPACGVPIGMQNTSKGHILKDARRIGDVLPSSHPEPSLVIAQSMLWDISHAANQGRPYRDDTQIAAWAQHAVDFLRHLVHSAFPCSLIAWRTSPPAGGGARSPGLIMRMNEAAKAAIAADSDLNRSVLILDYHAIMKDRIPKRDYDGDEAHPKRPDLLRLACMVFDMLEANGDGADPRHQHAHQRAGATPPKSAPQLAHESARREGCKRHRKPSSEVLDLAAAKELADDRRRKQHQQCPSIVKFLQTHTLDKWGKTLKDLSSGSARSFHRAPPVVPSHLSSAIHRSIGR